MFAPKWGCIELSSRDETFSGWRGGGWGHTTAPVMSGAVSRGGLTVRNVLTPMKVGALPAARVMNITYVGRCAEKLIPG